jgi:hypothetical protein
MSERVIGVDFTQPTPRPADRRVKEMRMDLVEPGAHGCRIDVFVTAQISRERVICMSTPRAAIESSREASQAELDEELRQAEEDFANGNYVDMTIEDLDQCITTGEWPWQRASSE